MEVSLGLQKFAVENGSACSATDSIVGKDCELPVEEITFAQPPHNC